MKTPHRHGFALPPRSALEQLVDDVVERRVHKHLPGMTTLGAELMQGLTPAVQWLVARTVDQVVSRELSHRTYSSLADLKWGLWTKFEADMRLWKASLAAQDLDPDLLDAFVGEQRAALANSIREMETMIHAAVTTPARASDVPASSVH